MSILCLRCKGARYSFRVPSFVCYLQARASQQGAAENGKKVLSQTVENLSKTKRDFTSYAQAGGISVIGTFTNGFVVVREYDEDQDLSDTETIQSDDAEDVSASAALVTSKRRGWGLALFGAKQNAGLKRRKEEKKPHFTLPRKSLSLSPLRLDHHPPGLKRRGSLEGTE